MYFHRAFRIHGYGIFHPSKGTLRLFFVAYSYRNRNPNRSKIFLAYGAGFGYHSVCYFFSVNRFMSVHNFHCMILRKIREADLIENKSFLFPAVPDEFPVNNRRNTVGKVSSHAVGFSCLLSVSINRCIINFSLAGPEQYKAVTSCFYQMWRGSTVSGSCII